MSFAYDSGGALDALIGLDPFLCPPLSRAYGRFTLDLPSGGPSFCQLSQSGSFSVIFLLVVDYRFSPSFSFSLPFSSFPPPLLCLVCLLILFIRLSI